MRQPSLETQLRTAKRQLNDEKRYLRESETKRSAMLTGIERLYRILSVTMGSIKDDDPWRAHLKLWSDELAEIKRMGL